MLKCVLPYVLLLIAAGSVFPHSVPLPHEKPLGWEQPVVITEEFFPSPASPHHPPNSPHHSEFKEIIGIELQRIPFHGGSEREILENERRKEHEILEHSHEPHIPPEILEHERREHEILSHELPPSDFLEQEHGEFEHHPHEFQDVLDHEQRELERREHELREHERREHEILEHEHPHDPHHPPWEDPDFVLSEEEHHHEHDHEFHHEELFPEVPRRRTNRRREGGSREGGSRRGNSNNNRRENSNRRGNSNRRENSNRQGNNNRRENSNREGSRRREGGSNINTEELFPRRNRQNNNSRRNNNNNNNNRRNNNREGSRRNSNLEELAALEEEVLLNPEEFSSHEISRPERDVGSYFSDNTRETLAYESSPFKQSESTHQSFGSSSNRPTNTNFDTKRLADSQGFISGDSILSNHERRFDNENSRRPSGREEETFGGSDRQNPSFSNSNKKYSTTSFESNSNINEYSSSGSNNRRPERPSSNIFLVEEDLGGVNSQRPHTRPVGSSFNNNNNYNNNYNNEQGWTQQGGIAEGSRPDYSNTFGSSRPEEFSNGESSRPSFLGSRPGSGKPIVPGSLSSQDNTRPNRPSSSSSGIYGNEDYRPSRPSSSSSGIYGNEDYRPSRPSSSSGIYGNEEYRPNRPSSSSSGIHGNEDYRPNRPFSGSSGGSNPSQESRPSGPGSQSSGLHSYQEEKPNQSSSMSTGLYSNQESPNRPSSSFSNLKPDRPSSGSSGHYIQFEERPTGSSSGLFSNQGTSRPSRPSNSHSSQEYNSHEQSSRPYGPSSRPDEGNSRPRPSNGNNLNNESDLISVQEDSWHWPNQYQDEDKQNRRALYSGNNKKHSTTTKRPNTSGSSKKRQHSNLKLLPTDSCGVDLGNKIIGGENTQLDEFPWMALLQHSSADGRALGFGCGGSLISPRYVLTAAHCIKGQAIGNNVRVNKVRLGEFDTSSDVDCQGDLCSPPPVDVAVEEIIVHPKYRATDRAQLNDIALIRLKENVKNSAYVSPICLPIYGNKDHVGEKLVVAGWGKTSNGQNGASSKTKQKVSVPVVSVQECSPFYNRINIQLNNTQMCAGGERGKDSCQGDSGGPLMGSEIIDSQVRWQVHGIVSFGPEDCGIDNVAGVYTKVSEYIDWILDNMKR